VNTDRTLRAITPQSRVEAVRACRFCGATLRHTFVDLGMSPPCESYLPADRLDEVERFYPLRVRVCEHCFLVQLHDYIPPEEIFTEYAYFSSFSEHWLAHARGYSEQMVDRFALGPNSLVVELASNDGYLLQYFVQQGIPVLGIEPAANVAPAAEERGVRTLVEFFDACMAARLREQGTVADLIVANNVLAQVPDLNSFVAGIRTLLAPSGVVTIEFPHLMRLVDENQFDTIYHEHFSYFSFLTTVAILAAHGLDVFDVEELWTHGGSLRVYATPAGHGGHLRTWAVDELLEREQRAGYDRIETYDGFEEQVRQAKRDLLRFLIGAKEDGRTVVGYGAPGKGNTLLNYCGIREDLLDYVVDRNPYKQGKFLPGTHIPIFSPERIGETRPDYVLILPWNFKDEIMRQMAGIGTWGGRFVVPIPETRIYAPEPAGAGEAEVRR
jgi:SAM-dependent methyltransferase